MALQKPLSNTWTLKVVRQTRTRALAGLSICQTLLLCWHDFYLFPSSNGSKTKQLSGIFLQYLWGRKYVHVHIHTSGYGRRGNGQSTGTVANTLHPLAATAQINAATRKTRISPPLRNMVEKKLEIKMFIISWNSLFKKRLLSNVVSNFYTLSWFLSIF